MSHTFEVTTDLIVHCKVRVRVEADSKDDAIAAVADLMPNNFDAGSRMGWKAKVAVSAPKGVDLVGARAYHFEQANGADVARKVTP